MNTTFQTAVRRAASNRWIFVAAAGLLALSLTATPVATDTALIVFATYAWLIWITAERLVLCHLPKTFALAHLVPGVSFVLIICLFSINLGFGSERTS